MNRPLLIRLSVIACLLAVASMAIGKGGYGTANPKKPKNPDRWLDGAEQRPGSWWLDWEKWIARHAGPRNVPARIPGAGKLKPIEDAPGSYVKAMSEAAPPDDPAE